MHINVLSRYQIALIYIHEDAGVKFFRKATGLPGIISEQIQIATAISLFFTGSNDVLTVPSPPLAGSGPTGTNFQCLRSVAQFRFQAGSHQSATAQAK